MKKQQLSQEAQELIIRYINADDPCESCGVDISSCHGCPKETDYKQRYIDPIYQYDYTLFHLANCAKQIKKEDYIIDLHFLKDIIK